MFLSSLTTPILSLSKCKPKNKDSLILNLLVTQCGQIGHVASSLIRPLNNMPAVVKFVEGLTPSINFVSPLRLWVWFIRVGIKM